MKYTNTTLAACLLASLASCGQQPSEETHVPGVQTRKGVVEVEPIESGRAVAGQTIYVPGYSAVYIADAAHRFELAITLSIRNTDGNQPIVVTAVKYYDHDGQVARDYLKKPVRILPMAAMEFFVKENDTSGGISSSFIVEWVAEQSVTAPAVESVMVGTASTQGISFTCPGRVLSDRSRKGPDGEGSR